MSNTLKLVLTDHWFEEIKSGRKTHEYRKVTEFWEARISKIGRLFLSYNDVFVEFQKAYRKNPEKMTFKIKNITVVNGLDTDLHCEGDVFDIELGDRIDE